jgi:hypothetical protein
MLKMKRVLLFGTLIFSFNFLYGFSLQEKFAKKAFPQEKIEVNHLLYTKTGHLNREHYVYPNEQYPQRLIDHLSELHTSGVFAAVGADRVFILAGLAGPKCTGIVGVDIDPVVLLYSNFLLLLFDFSKNKEEFQLLRDAILRGEKTSQEKLMTFVEKLDMPKKGYYQNNLRGMFSIATAYSQMILGSGLRHFAYPDKPDIFKGANYLRDDALFRTIKELVEAGQVLFVSGNIYSDLADFERVPFVLIDSSNVEESYPGIATHYKLPVSAHNPVMEIRTSDAAPLVRKEVWTYSHRFLHPDPLDSTIYNLPK